MTDLTNEVLSFIPLEEERSAGLTDLFDKVNILIANHMVNNKGVDEKMVRRFVAGEVCREDLSQSQCLRNEDE